MCKIPVFVIRSNDHCFLDIIRSLGCEGIPVVPVVFTWEGAGEWFSEKSIYYSGAVEVCNPAENEEKAKGQLLELGKKYKEKYKEKILIIPSSDTSLVFLQKYFSEFGEYFYQMGHGNFEKECLKELSKSEFALLMEEANVNIPKTLNVKKMEDIESVADRISYPCVYKPIMKDIGNSFQRVHNQKKAIESENKGQLVENLRNELEAGYQLVVQEKIVFDTLEEEVSIYAYADSTGNILMFSGLHKVFEYPHPYGTGIVCMQYISEELVAEAKKVMRALKWHGFACIEFMKNRKNGKWVVIEVNLRPWLSVDFQRVLGFNYIAQLYWDVYSKCEMKKSTRISVNNNFLMIDIVKFIEKELEEKKNLFSAIQAVEEYIGKNVGRCVFSYYLPGDKEPGVCEKKSLIKKYGNIEKFNKLYEIMENNNRELLKTLKKSNLERKM